MRLANEQFERETETRESELQVRDEIPQHSAAWTVHMACGFHRERRRRATQSERQRLEALRTQVEATARREAEERASSVLWQREEMPKMRCLRCSCTTVGRPICLLSTCP
jgi:hypothetical protein